MNVQSKIPGSILLCLGALISLTTAAHPQQRDTNSFFRNAALHNWYVRAVSSDSSISEGRIRFLAADSIQVGRSHVAVTSLLQLDRRIQEGGGRGAGAFIGALAVGGLFAAIASGFCEFSCDGAAVKAFLPGAVLGGGLGAAIGEAVAPAKQRWRQVWP